MFTEALNQGDVPQPLTKRPDLDPGLQFIYDGYFEMGRPSGMGGGPSFEDKIYWMNHYGVTAMVDQEFVLSCWRSMRPVDDELSEDLSEREGKAKRKNSAAPKSQVMGSGHVK
jgi:hypothetical protein